MLACCRSKRDLVKFAADAQALMGLVLALTGFATYFASTAVGVLAVALGLLSARYVRPDIVMAGRGCCGLKPISVVWFVTRAQTVFVVLAVPCIGLSAYCVARPNQRGVLALCAAGVSVGVSATAAVCGVLVLLELPSVVEAVFAAAALQAVRQMRYTGAGSGADTVSLARSTTGNHPGRTGAERAAGDRDVDQRRTVNALANLPQVTHRSAFIPVNPAASGAFEEQDAAAPDDTFNDVFEASEHNPLADADLR